MLPTPPGAGGGLGQDVSPAGSGRGSHPPPALLHTYKLENQYLLGWEGAYALLLEMEAHSPERPHQCAWQLQRLHQRVEGEPIIRQPGS